jgi:hypothetical protein
LAFGAAVICGSACANDAGGREIFVSWDDFETDKLASIWLIRRFVNPEALIRILPKGTPIVEGAAFDTPDAGLRRYHDRSTFESILRRYGLTDPKLVYLGKIIHDIEINTWERKAFEESFVIRREINALISSAKDHDDLMERSSAYFDGLYRQGNEEKETG